MQDKEEHVDLHVDIKKLPSFSGLAAKVKEIENDSSWFERYGIDWCFILFAFAIAPVGFILLSSESTVSLALGMFILGCCHATWTDKGSHLSSHGALCDSPKWGKFWFYFFVEFIGSFSGYMGNYTHIKMHHPHTNIIGLGDSSSWKVPSLSRDVYMFFAPLLVPAITPLVAMQQLIELRKFKELLMMIPVVTAGIAIHIAILMKVSGFGFLSALCCLFTFRAVLSIPYIHVNIFQHIGLPMYSPKSRPSRIYQMSSGVLNLDRNYLLDYTFGHSLINCHIEHHLFPRLSDNMCLKVKPIVKDYLLSNGLPYQEKPYMERLAFFIENYKKLMQDAPPITHFVGIQ